MVMKHIVVAVEELIIRVGYDCKDDIRDHVSDSQVALYIWPNGRTVILVKIYTATKTPSSTG